MPSTTADPTTATTAGATATATSTGPATGLTTRQLETELLGLAGHLAAAQCRFLLLLAEFDRRGGWAGVGVRSCAHWLSWRIGMSLRTATEHVRVAHALTTLPRITEAFAAGRISYSKVRAITRITGTHTGADGADTARVDSSATATELTNPTSDNGEPTPQPPSPEQQPPAQPSPAQPSPDQQPTEQQPTEQQPTEQQPSEQQPTPTAEDTEKILLDLALAGTASHVETVVRAVRRRRSDAATAAARRSLSWHWAEDGSLVLRGRLAPAEGAALIAAVEELVPPREPVSHPVPKSPDGWRQRAVEESPGAVADRIAARRADALLALVTGTTGGGGAAPVVQRGRARIIVHVDATTGSARIAGGPELPTSTAERLACDAHAQVLLEDTTRNRLYLGRNKRLASPAQIAALTVRDEGSCRFPGCHATRYLHAHHVRPWLRGGRTDVDNLVLLCSFHHTVVHDRGYRIHRLAAGWEVRRPDGSPVPGTGEPLTGNVESLIEIDTRAGLRLTRDCLTPSWGGERLDPEPILDALLPRVPVPEMAA